VPTWLVASDLRLLTYQDCFENLSNDEKAGFAAGLFACIPKKRNYFLGAIASLAALATRNFTTVLALI
jgi:hypothetical protein